MDTRDEEDVLHAAPAQGKIPIIGVTICALITAVFGVMCWVDTYKKFAIVLAVFWLLDMLAWKYLMFVILEPAMDASIRVYRQDKDFFLLEQVQGLKTFLTGGWHWWRFWIGLIAIGGVNILTFSDIGTNLAERVDIFSKTSFLSQWFRQKSGSDSAVSSEFVIAGMIFHHSRVKSELLHK